MSIILASIDYVKMANEINLIKLHLKSLNNLGVNNIHTIGIESNIEDIIKILDNGIEPYILSAIKPGG